MKALIVGAGAVGQVFGHHLARGGAEVTFLVKPKYVDEVKRGFTLYQLRRTAPVKFTGAAVTSEPSGGFDQVYVTVSSTALRAGTFFADLAKQTGDATIVCLQPGMDDHAFVVEHAGAARIVDGQIQFLAYHAPLPGETRFPEPGCAYWLFPGKAPFAGERAADVVAALRAGGLPAKRVANLARTSAFPAAVLNGFIMALEAAGWSFEVLRRDGFTRLGARAAREAMSVVEKERDVRAPLGPRLVARPLVMRALLRIASGVAPVDLETYLRVHFTKVGDQMHEGLAKYISRGRELGLDVDALENLARRLQAPGNAPDQLTFGP